MNDFWNMIIFLWNELHLASWTCLFIAHAISCSTRRAASGRVYKVSSGADVEQKVLRYQSEILWFESCKRWIITLRTNIWSVKISSVEPSSGYAEKLLIAWTLNCNLCKKLRNCNRQLLWPRLNKQPQINLHTIRHAEYFSKLNDIIFINTHLIHIKCFVIENSEPEISVPLSSHSNLNLKTHCEDF